MTEIPAHKRTYYFFNKQMHQLGDYFRRMSFPGSNGVPIYDVIPENSYIAIETLLDEIFRKHASLQIFGFLVTVFFAHKGLTGVIDAFNATYHTVEPRPWMESRLVSLGLICILFLLLSFS